MPKTDYNENRKNEHDEYSAPIQNTSGKVFDINIFAVDFSKGTKRFWYVIVAISVIFGLLTAFVQYRSYTPMYESSVSFSVSAVTYTANGSAVFASYYDNNSAEQLTKTFPYIANTALMRNALKEELGADYINGSITAESVASDTNIFKVSVRSNSAKDAYDIVNAVVAVYPDVAAFVVGNVSLNILIKPALPDEPYTTNNFIRSGAIMALIGAVMAFGLIALYAFVRNTVRKKDDFKNKLNQKCYVEIPNVIFHRKTNDKKMAKRLIRLSDNHPTYKEAFRLLRKRLMRNLKDNEKIIAVTSALAGEGKTTVAFNLAHTLALTGKKVACIDFDLKTKSLQKYFASQFKLGFVDCIIDNMDFKKAATEIENNLDVYFAGTKDSVISSDEFADFFSYLRKKYEYIIVNLATCSDVADTVTYANMCDCILMVAKQDFASIERIRKSIENLSFSTARILGFAFNSVQEGFSGYGSYYYGGKYGYGKYGYGRHIYGRYGYGGHSRSRYGYGTKKYGYGYGYGRSYGYGYGYGYGEEPEDDHKRRRPFAKRSHYDVDDLPDSEIPDNNI